MWPLIYSLVLSVPNMRSDFKIYRYRHHKTAYKYTGLIILEYAKNLFQHIFGMIIY